MTDPSRPRGRDRPPAIPAIPAGYRAVRWLARMSLTWFYRDVETIGIERIPRDGPVLFAVNHPNALMDAMAIGAAVPRRVLITAKATLFANPVVAFLLSWIGVVPLRRAIDERRPRVSGEVRAGAGAGAGADAGVPPRQQSSPDSTLTSHRISAPGTARARNAESFTRIVDALAAGGAVLLFPEGRTHNDPQLSPLKTGLARIALESRDGRGVRGITVVPVGLVFERKWEPRSRLLVTVGEPLALDGWQPDTDRGVAEQLTAEVERRLRDVTLNFPSPAARDEAQAVAQMIAIATAGRALPLGRPDPPLPEAVALARRAAHVRTQTDATGGDSAASVARYRERYARFSSDLTDAGVDAPDLLVDLGLTSGARFAVRESMLLLIGGPLALWGRINHWIPLRAARAIAQRTSRSAEDPATHTVVIGLGLVLLCYALQSATVAFLAGGWWALLYLCVLPISASWDLRSGDRRRHAARRMRTYLRLRRDPALRDRLRAELEWIRTEGEALERNAG